MAEHHLRIVAAALNKDGTHQTLTMSCSHCDTHGSITAAPIQVAFDLAALLFEAHIEQAAEWEDDDAA